MIPRGWRYVEPGATSPKMKGIKVARLICMSREEQLSQELAARQVLRRLEERREKSIKTQVDNRNEYYDKQRQEVLSTLSTELLDLLAQDDEAQKAYLKRLGEPVTLKSRDLEEIVEV
jgi:hypothetical protein